MAEPEFTSCMHIEVKPMKSFDDDIKHKCNVGHRYLNKCWEASTCPDYKPVTMEFLIETLAGIG